MATLTFAVIAVPINTHLSSPTQNIQDGRMFETELNDSVPYDITSFNNETYQCKVASTITINEYGGVVEQTKVNITNNGSAMFNSFDFTVPTDENEHMHHLSLKDLSNRTQPEFVLTSSDENDTTYTIHTPNIEEEDTYDFMILKEYSYTKILEIGDSTLTLNKSFLPLLSIPITSLDLTVRLPGELPNTTTVTPNVAPFNATIEGNAIFYQNLTHLPLSNLNISLLPILFNYPANAANMTFIPGFQKELRTNMTYYLSFSYTPSFPVLEYNSVIRTIKINQWGSIITEEEITFINRGPSTLTLSALSIGISKNATFKSATDIYGNLSATINPVVTINQVNIRLRLPLEMDTEYSIKCQYQESIKTGIEEFKGKLIIKPWLLSFFNLTIREYQMNVILPYGAQDTSYENFTRAPDVSYSTEKGFLGHLIPFLAYSKISFTFANLTSLDNSPGIAISYKLDKFTWFLYDPLIMMTAFLLVGIIYIVIRLAMTASWGLAAPVVVEIPYEEIERFVRAYEEKTSLQERLKRLTLDYRRRKVPATKYEKSKTLLDHKITEAERDLVQVAGILRKKGRRYDTGVHSIEVAELEREDVLENIRRLEKRRSDGAIGKDAYNRLKRDYNRQLQRANNKIDKALIELRASLTEGR